jgi:hypothetical protein
MVSEKEKKVDVVFQLAVSQRTFLKFLDHESLGAVGRVCVLFCGHTRISSFRTQ